MSTYYYYGETLYHHGVKGQKWGHRQWQNEDGSLTPAGREHYGYGAKAEYKNRVGIAKANYKQGIIKSVKANSSKDGSMTKDQIKKFDSESKNLAKKLQSEKKAAKEAYKQTDEYKARQEKIKKAAITGAAIAATALAAYGAYKVVNGKIANQNAEKLYSKGVEQMKTAKMMDTLSKKYSEINAYYANGQKGNDISKSLKYMDKSWNMKRASNNVASAATKNLKKANKVIGARNAQTKMMDTLSKRYSDVNKYYANGQKGNDISKSLKYMDKSWDMKEMARAVNPKRR